MSFVYVFSAEGRTKIGLANNVERRRSGLEKAMGARVACRGFRAFPSRDSAGQAERLLHKEFAAHRLLGEWFTIDPAAALASLNRMDAPASSVAVVDRSAEVPPDDLTQQALDHLDRLMERDKARRRAA